MLERQYRLQCGVATRHEDARIQYDMKTSVTRVKTSHRGSGGHGLARHSGTCDWSFLEVRVFRVGATKAGHFIHATTTAVLLLICTVTEKKQKQKTAKK